MQGMRIIRAASAIAAILIAGACTVSEKEPPALTGPSSFVTPPAPSGPTANFTFTPSSPTANTPVAFNGATSCPEAGFSGGCVKSDRAITSFGWDFGDGATATGPAASHVFRGVGSFNVSLTVVNDRGLSSTAFKSVTIMAGAPPTADFVVSANGLRAVFDASISKAAQDQTIIRYEWVFGDSPTIVTTNDRTIAHMYPVAGSYSVTLTVTDTTGRTGSTSKTVNMTP